MLSTKLLGKCGLFWSQLVDEIEALHIHFITSKYGENTTEAGMS